MLGLSVWLAAIVVGTVVFEYSTQYSVKADLFVSACLSAATGAYVAIRKRAPTAPIAFPVRVSEVRLAQLLGMLGILGSIFLLIDAQASGTPLSLGYLLDNLGSLRAEQFEALEEARAQSALKSLGTYLASCSFLSVLAAARYGRLGGLRLLAITNFVLFAAVSVFVYVGRANMFNLALLFLVSAYLLGRRLLPRNPRTLAVLIASAIGIWYFSVPYLATREQYASPIRVLAETQRAAPREALDPLARRNPNVGYGLISIGYFASSPANLSFYIQQTPLPGPLWGSYSYPLPGRILTKLTGTGGADLWLKAREQIFLPLVRAGYFPNVWSTWLRDLLVDFGYLGAVLFCALFGGFIARERNLYEKTGLLYHHFFEAIACLIFTFGVFTGLMWSAFLANGFFFTIAIAVFVRLGVFSVSPVEPAQTRPVTPRPHVGRLA